MVIPAVAPSLAVPAEHPDFDANINTEVTNRLNAEVAAGRTPAEILAASETLLNSTPARRGRLARIGLRQQFAESAARHTDTGFRRGSKEDMDAAGWDYAIALGMAGACAFSEMADSAATRRNAAGDPPDAAADAAEARGMAALQYVHRSERVMMRRPGAARNAAVHGEGAMLADAVADARRERVDADGNRRGPRSWPTHAFNAVAEGWGRLGRRTQRTIKIAATVGTIAATVLTAGATAPLSAARKKTFDALDHRAEVLNSHDQNDAVRQEISNAYRTGGVAAGRVPTLRQMIQPHTNTAENRHRQNRRNTYWAVGTLVVSGVLGDVVANNAPGIGFLARAADRGFHVAAHSLDHVAHDQIAGYGSHAAGAGHGTAGHAAGNSGGTTQLPGTAGHAAGNSGGTTQLPGSETFTVTKPLEVLNPHETAELHRKWIDSAASHYALQNHVNGHGVEITTQGLNLPHGSEALITVHTAGGNELIEVPLNSHGAAEVHGSLAELLKAHGEVSEEIGTVAHGHADIYSTFEANGNAQLSSSAVAHMAQEAGTQTHLTEVTFTPAQIHELAAQQQAVFKEFAANVHGIHGATTEGLFGQAVTHALATHQLELVTTSHGSVEIVDPSVGINPAANGHIYQMLLRQLQEATNSDEYTLAA